MLPWCLSTVTAVLALLTGAHAEVVTVVSSPLSIAAFNVQRFGISKLGKPEVMELLTQVRGGLQPILQRKSERSILQRCQSRGFLARSTKTRFIDLS